MRSVIENNADIERILLAGHVHVAGVVFYQFKPYRGGRQLDLLAQVKKAANVTYIYIVASVTRIGKFKKECI